MLIELKRCVLAYAASTSAKVFKWSAALMAGSVPVSTAMSNCAIVPMKASGTQLSAQFGSWNA